MKRVGKRNGISQRGRPEMAYVSQQSIEAVSTKGSFKWLSQLNHISISISRDMDGVHVVWTTDKCVLVLILETFACARLSGPHRFISTEPKTTPWLIRVIRDRASGTQPTSLTYNNLEN